MADKKVVIQVSAETKEAEGALKKIEGKFNKFAKGISGNDAVKAASELGAGIVNILNVCGKLATGVKAAVAAMKQLSDAALGQVRAEKQLEAAARNNPYLNREAVLSLKEFAGQLQQIGTVGDEELIPMMARLAAAGRTQAEIQDVMAAALDIAASGAMSLDGAVQALNQSYSGTAGQLGRAVPAVKSLTREQLRNGEAVKLVAKQYAGMAKASADASGAGDQLKNAWGDLMEQLGMGIVKLVKPFQKFFTWTVQRFADLAKAVNEVFGLAEDTWYIKGSDKAKDELDEIDRRLESIRRKIEAVRSVGGAMQEAFDLQEAYDRNLAEYEALKKKKSAADARLSDEEKRRFIELAKWKRTKSEQWLEEIEEAKYLNSNPGADNMVEPEENARLLAEAEVELAAVMQERNEKQEEYNRLLEEERAAADAAAGDEMDRLNASLDAQLARIEAKYSLEMKLHGTYDEKAKCQERVNAMTDAYLALMEAEVSDESVRQELAVRRLEQLEAEDGRLRSLCGTHEKYAKLVDKWAAASSAGRLEQLEAELEALKQYQADMEEAGAATEDAFRKVEQAIDSCQKSIDELNLEKLRENVQSVVDCVGDAVQSLSDSVSSVCDAALSENEREAEDGSAALQSQYEDGLISYEDYLAQKDELDKQAAQREYKIKLAQWTMDLAMAQVNAAQAVLKALSSGQFSVSIVNAAAAGILGAAQVAAVVGAKPSPPSFSTGGFLTGASTSGDKIPFMGNAGEAVLNPAEQRNFMDMANGTFQGGSVVVNLPITVENNASDAVSVGAMQDDRQIVVTVNKVVNANMQKGMYNDSLQTAQAAMKGVSYL